MDTYLNVVDWVSKKNSRPVESFVALLPTAPLRTPEDIDREIKIFNSKNANSVISVVEAPVPISWYRQITKKGLLKNLFPNFDALKNRQELKRAYVPNGAIYVFKTEVLRLKRQYYTSKTYPYIMPKERSADIDDKFDFEWARYIFKKNNKKASK